LCHGQTIVNVEMGKGRSRISTAGIVLLVLVTALSEVMAKIPMAVLAGIMAIVAIKTFSWHSIQPATVKGAPIAETVVMLVTVAATVSTGNLAIGVLGGIIVMAILPARIKRRHELTSEKSSPAQEK
jgi:SulP family sulfate permease